MKSKELEQGLQRIIDGFENGDYPYESDFIDILKGAIEKQDACSHSALNGGVSKHLDRLQAKILDLFQEHRKQEAPYKTQVSISAYKLQELMAEAKKQVDDAC